MSNQTAKSFRDLIVWQKAHHFVLLAYRFSRSFPSSETYGLTSQLRRAAVSVPANISEGFKRKTLWNRFRSRNVGICWLRCSWLLFTIFLVWSTFSCLGKVSSYLF
ncbi:MAG: four helix bundle protein, partial [Okeania sp. SIO2C9]|uniref:four helix bundle protein n=1 Tax=Okeania sp. SIO2C9 TaxID=2607791 RepID=UPI0013C264B4